uniref:Uncharacterized protein n=1 Tax=Populus trichocarpa TaxID=3694 RepID=A0A3N7F153_POPTR
MLSKNFEVNCLKDGDIHVRNLALGDGVAECLNEIEIKKLSISTKLMNFENEFDPYGAMSTPLYHTITFKQPSAIENGQYDHTRSGNPTRDALGSLLAKLIKEIEHHKWNGCFDCCHSSCWNRFKVMRSILSTCLCKLVSVECLLHS